MRRSWRREVVGDTTLPKIRQHFVPMDGMISLKTCAPRGTLQAPITAENRAAFCPDGQDNFLKTCAPRGTLQAPNEVIKHKVNSPDLWRPVKPENSPEFCPTASPNVWQHFVLIDK